MRPQVGEHCVKDTKEEEEVDGPFVKCGLIEMEQSEMS